MKVVSVNVARPAAISWRGRSVSTAFLKRAVSGSVAIQGTSVQGDLQADPRVHGGPRKAVYVYPSEHYEFWKRELPGVALPHGSFGENLTTEGLREEGVHPGDHLKIGTAELVVTQPRFPCIKMAFRFQREDIVRRFQLSGRSGFYLGVAREGTVEAGDPIELVRDGGDRTSIAELFRRHGEPEVEEIPESGS